MNELTQGTWYLVYQTFDEEVFRQTGSEEQALRAGFVREVLGAGPGMTADDARQVALNRWMLMDHVVASDGQTYPVSPKVVYAEELQVDQLDFGDIMGDHEEAAAQNLRPELVGVIDTSLAPGAHLGRQLAAYGIECRDLQVPNLRCYIPDEHPEEPAPRKVYLFSFGRLMRTREVRSWFRDNGYEPSGVFSLVRIGASRRDLTARRVELVALGTETELPHGMRMDAMSLSLVDGHTLTLNVETDPETLWDLPTLFLATRRTGGLR